MLCFLRNSHDVMALLLRRGADYTVRNKEGKTILHYAASYGDIKTLEIVEAHNLIDLDLQAKDRQGETALDILEQSKNHHSLEFIETFYRIIGKVRFPQRFVEVEDLDGDETSLDDEFEFVDAVEEMEGKNLQV